MSLVHLIADAIQSRTASARSAQRSPRVLGLSSGPRHPIEAESNGVQDPRPAPSKPIARPRVAWGG